MLVLRIVAVFFITIDGFGILRNLAVMFTIFINKRFHVIRYSLPVHFVYRCPVYSVAVFAVPLSVIAWYFRVFKIASLVEREIVTK